MERISNSTPCTVPTLRKPRNSKWDISFPAWKFSADPVGGLAGDLVQIPVGTVEEELRWCCSGFIRLLIGQEPVCTQWSTVLPMTPATSFLDNAGWPQLPSEES